MTADSPLTESKIKTIALYAGLLSLAAGIGMAFEYGRAMSYLHAISLSLLAIAGSIGFIGAAIIASKGWRHSATVVRAATVVLLFAEYGTHFGYTVGHRARDTEETGVQNATYKAAQDSRESEKTNLALWREQLKTLMEQNAWAATVKADGLRAELPAIDKAIELETSRGGCKTKCQALMKDKAALEKRISTAEQREDLSKRIEATQRILDTKVDTAAKTEFRSSKIVNQTKAFAQVAMWDANPSTESMSWVQLILGAIIAAVTTYLAPFFFSIAFSDIGSKRTEDEPTASAPITARHQDGYSKPASLLPTHRETLIVHNNDKLNEILARWAGSNEARAIAA